MSTTHPPPPAYALYLNLIERCLLNTIYEDAYTDWTKPSVPLPFDSRKRQLGRDWPTMAHTMIGQERLRALRLMVEEAITAGIPGDFIETGVWRGGACILMRAVLKAYGVTDRRVFVADSFAGLPPPNPALYPADQGDIHYTYSELAVSLEQVQQNFRKYDLLDDQVVFVKGWFRDTLRHLPINKLAVLRLDGDMYESTAEALQHLYDKVSPCGFIIVDDFGCIPQCRAAVEDFWRQRGLVPKAYDIDGMGIFWRKEAATEPPQRKS